MRQPQSQIRTTRANIALLKYVALAVVDMGDRAPSPSEALGEFATMTIERLDPNNPPETFATKTGGDTVAVALNMTLDGAARAKLAALAYTWAVPQATVLRTILLDRAKIEAWTLPPHAGGSVAFSRTIYFPSAPDLALPEVLLQPETMDAPLWGFIDRFRLFAPDWIERSMMFGDQRDAWVTRAAEHLAEVDTWSNRYASKPLSLTTRVPCGWIADVCGEDTHRRTMPPDDFLRIAYLTTLGKHRHGG